MLAEASLILLVTLFGLFSPTYEDANDFEATFDEVEAELGALVEKAIKEKSYNDMHSFITAVEQILNKHDVSPNKLVYVLVGKTMVSLRMISPRYVILRTYIKSEIYTLIVFPRPQKYETTCDPVLQSDLPSLDKYMCYLFLNDAENADVLVDEQARRCLSYSLVATVGEKLDLAETATSSLLTRVSPPKSGEFYRVCNYSITCWY